MSNEVLIILPNQLFIDHPLLAKERPVILLEAKRYFTDFKFHKKKLVLHRASMKAYQDFLEKKNFDVEYIEFDEFDSLEEFFREKQKSGLKTIYSIEIIDKKLQTAFTSAFRELEIRWDTIDSPAFLTSRKTIKAFFEGQTAYHMKSFYIMQRKRLSILVSNEKPVGGKWSFDTENRKKIPKNLKLPVIKKFGTNEFVKEAKEYVERKFPNNPGKVTGFIYPTTFSETRKWLADFFKKRLNYFGDYEDAIVKTKPFLFHSILSPLLNIGLITPSFIIKKVIDYNSKNDVRLNSLEGFIRQIIGWREYIRAVYELEEDYAQRNYWQFNRQIPRKFYNAKTGLKPVDQTIQRVMKYAYCHHIERLMILGNYLLLCEIDPFEIYKWFMEMFIDSYDWVMLPNVFGMSQFADGGLMSTKPYISSSNYILKMSDYAKGDWCKIFDSLYWNFITAQRSKLEKNPRMTLMLSILDKKSAKQKTNYIETANSYISKLEIPSDKEK